MNKFRSFLNNVFNEQLFNNSDQLRVKKIYQLNCKNIFAQSGDFFIRSKSEFFLILEWFFLPK